jgi:hypothetical protein
VREIPKRAEGGEPMMTDTLKLIYPTKRRITEREVIAWAWDRMIDNAIEVKSLRYENETGKTLSDEAIDRIANDVPAPTLRDAIERLEDDGVATFSRTK